MVRRRLALVLRLAFALGLAAPFFARVARAAAPAPAPSLPVEEHRLANGLRVLLAPDDALDDVSVVVRYGAGAADDPAGKEGLAHVVEHLLFRGSRHVAAGEHARAVKSAGGYGVEARTTLDATIYEETVPPEALALALWLESDRMGFVSETIGRDTLAKEQKIVADERRDRVVDDAGGRFARELLDQVFPPWHPYNADEDGASDDASVEAIDVRDVRAFLRTWYGPANATLAIAGRFDPKATMALVTRYFGSLSGALPPERPRLPERRVARRTDYAAPLVREQIGLGWPTPAFRTPDDRALDLVAVLLAGPHGKLQTALRGRGLRADVGARQQSHDRGSMFVVSARPQIGESGGAVLDEIEHALAGIAAGVAADDLARAKKWLADRTRFVTETARGRASELASSAPGGSPWERGAYDAIDAAAVAAAARRWLPWMGGAAVIVHAVRNAPPQGIVIDRWERGE